MSERSKIFSKDLSSLLSLSEQGCLPEGVFSATLCEVERTFVIGEVREFLWRNLLTFIQRYVSPTDFPILYIGGDFLMMQAEPQDIDIILQTEAQFGPESFEVMKPFFVFGLDQIRQDYGIHLHFWSEGFPGRITDLRDFFQNVKRGDSLQLNRAIKHGIIEIRLSN